MSPDLDLRWLERAGYKVDIAEVEPGIYSVTLTHVKNSAMRFSNVARGASEHLAIAHAREQLEEALTARPPRSRHYPTPTTIIATRYSGGHKGGVWAACLWVQTRCPKPPWGTTWIARNGGRRPRSLSDWEQHRTAPSRHSTTLLTDARTQSSFSSRYQQAWYAITASSFAGSDRAPITVQLRRGRLSTEVFASARVLHRTRGVARGRALAESRH